jgi:CRISPR-associated protein Cmr5
MALNQPSSRRTIEQKRAAEAWDAILEVEHESEQDRLAKERNPKLRGAFHGEYGSLSRGLPAMIQVNGLAMTMAFLYSKIGTGDKIKKEYQYLYTHISKRIKNYLLTRDEVLEFIRAASTDQYRRATTEAIAYAIWLKRYAEGKNWKSKDGGSNQDEEGLETNEQPAE